MVLSSMQLQTVSVTLWFRRLQCLVLRSVLSVFSTCVLQSVCVHTMDFVSAINKQINTVKTQLVSFPREYTEEKGFLCLAINYRTLKRHTPVDSAKWLRVAPKSPGNVTSTFLICFQKISGLNKGAPNLFLLREPSNLVTPLGLFQQREVLL